MILLQAIVTAVEHGCVHFAAHQQSLAVKVFPYTEAKSWNNAKLLVAEYMLLAWITVASL